MIYKRKHKKFIIPNPYNIPPHNQGNRKNCTAHAFAGVLEFQLSSLFKERTIVDVEDLWEKQKKYGTATEEEGDIPDGPFIIADKHGVKFRTDSGINGVVIGGKILLK